MKSLLLISVLIFLLQLLSNGSAAQSSQIKFNLVEGNNGEPLGQINAITQDRNGYMWFNGQGANRIYRYDGVRMTAYKPHNLHPDIKFGVAQETIYADSITGLIWIGFIWGGLEAFNPATGVFKDYKYDSTDAGSISAGMVSAILRDHLGRLWIGTAEGLDLLDEKTGKFIHYRSDPKDSTSLSSNVVRALYEDHEGALWIGTGYEFDLDVHKSIYKNAEDGGLNRMEKDGKFTRFMHDPKNPHSLINNKIKAIFEDSRGTFWIGTSGDGLHTMDRKKGTFERHTYDPANPEELSRPPLKKDNFGDPITFITEDATGAIWIGTYISGMNRYDPVTKKITHYESSNGYPDKNCWTAFNSSDGSLWLSSTDPVGFLYRVDPEINRIKQFVSPGADINCIYEDYDGSLWESGYKSGILQFDKNKRLLHQFKYDATDSIDLMHADINSIFEDRHDTLWICGNPYMILFDKKTKHFARLRYKESPGSPLKIFSAPGLKNVIKDQSGLMWISSDNGLFRYDPRDRSIKQYTHDEKDPATICSDLITSVLESGSGDIWASSGDKEKISSLSGISFTQGGLNRLNKTTGKFIHYLDGVNILCMYKDSRGIIWAGSVHDGIYYFDKQANQFSKFFSPGQETGKDAIINIIEDELKNLWVITPSSIIKINADRKNSFVYGKKYGIRANTLHSGGLCITKTGDILVRNNDGFYTLSPKEMNEQARPFPVIITNLLINNHEVSSKDSGVLTLPIEQIKKISLDYNQNNFFFNFAAIDFRAPEATKYYTLLENFDSIWRDAGEDKSANYINVPTGHYIFRVKAINIDGVKAEKAIAITVMPPWWKTWWAYGIYALLMMTVILLTHRFQRRRTLSIERQRAQAKELLQAKEIEKAYHKLEQTYAELKSTQAQLIQSEKMASLGELTAGIAHEIQNPLNFVNNFSEVNAELIEELNAERLRPKAERNEKFENEILDDIKQNLEKINLHGKRADNIVKGMLQHSRTSSGQKETTDINALADEYLRLAYHGLRAKDKSFNATFKTEFDPGIGQVNVVPQDIGRVLLNLYNNAFYAVLEKKKQIGEDFDPTVTVSTIKIDNIIEIRVKDNGKGIPQKVLDKIFQPFFTTKPAGQGTGLGLSLSYDIIAKEHSGQITVETREGEYTIFIIRLPV